MRNLPRLLPALFCICGLMASGCHFGPRHWVDEDESLTIPVDTLSRVECRTHNGRIDFQADPSALESIGVDVRKKAGGDDEADALDCLAAIEIVKSYRGGVLTLGWRWSETRHSNWQAAVSFSVRPPPDVFARAETHNGPVRLDGMHGGAAVLSHNGSLVLTDCADDVNAETHNGPIDVTLNSSNVRLKTHNGGIQARLNTTANIDGRIESHNGGILITFGPESSTRIECSSHNVALQAGAGVRVLSRSRRSLVTDVGDGEGRLVATTHNGRIKLEQAFKPRP